MASLSDNLSKTSSPTCRKIELAQSGILRAMSTASTQLQFNSAYCQRVKELREGKDWTSEQMAIALGIPAERYRKYESRSPMPPYLVERFALIVGKDVEYVLTGKSSQFRRAG